MTRRLATLIGVLVAVMAGTLVLAAQQKPVAADVLLGQALHQEESEGRLEDAINSYKKVLAAADATREQKARAQFRIGACYERLGLAEARKAYEAVIADFADQAELAAEAKARLAALAQPAVRGGGPALRQIWATSGNVDSGRISPDGRSVVGVDEGTGDLIVRSVVNGEIRRLTNIPVPRQWSDYAASPVWSRDGRRIAYQWTKWERANLSSVEFRIADVADGTSRVVPMDARFRMDSPFDWSPDGRRVLARVEEGPPENTLQHLAWVPASGGTLQLLASAGVGKELGPACLSPDGAWIVTRIPSDDTAFSIIAARGGPLRALMGAAASDSLVGWSPDGTSLLFISREGRDDELMAVRVADGRAVGRPLRIRTQSVFQWIDVSRTGALIYLSAHTPRTNVFRATFDRVSGRVGTPSRVDVTGGVSSVSVSWSPDGRRLAYVSWPEGKPARTLSIWSADTGLSRSFGLPFNATKNAISPTTWSADGRRVYVAEGSNDMTRESLYRVDTDTGTAETLVLLGMGALPLKDPNRFFHLGGWSPDGRVAYRVERISGTGQPEAGAWTIIEHRVADHAERELFRTDAAEVVVMPTWQVSSSPDGSELAFCLSAIRARTSRIMLMPAAGGPARMVAELPMDRAPIISWTPDGQSLILRRPGGKLIGPAEAWLREVATGATVKIAFPVDEVYHVALSPDGKEIAYIGGYTPPQGVWILENFLPTSKK